MVFNDKYSLLPIEKKLEIFIANEKHFISVVHEYKNKL